MSVGRKSRDQFDDSDRKVIEAAQSAGFRVWGKNLFFCTDEDIAFLAASIEQAVLLRVLLYAPPSGNA